MKDKSIVLLHGVFDNAFFDDLKKANAKEVFILEGRPGLNSSKKTSRELIKRKIQPTVISDNMAGVLFYKGWVKEVRIAYEMKARQGTLSQIGSVILAVLGKKHKVSVTAYPSTEKSALMGSQKDILEFTGVKVAPDGVQGYVPLVEWVPKKYITKIL